jgi:acyl-CoA dehydrogenase
MSLDTETFDALIDTVRRFVSERLRPSEAVVAESDQIPDDLVAEMKNLGLFGLSIDPQYGGLGLSMLEEIKVAIELGKTSPAMRSSFGTNVGIGSQGLVMAGTAEQKAQWLPKIASGEIITSFALTEPDIGSDSANVKTRAVRDGNHWKLTGTKRYITNADKASLFTVMARTGEDGARGVSAFLVTANSPGLTIGTPARCARLRRQFRQCRGATRKYARGRRRWVQGRHACSRPRATAYIGRLRWRCRTAHC